MLVFGRRKFLCYCHYHTIFFHCWEPFWKLGNLYSLRSKSLNCLYSMLQLKQNKNIYRSIFIIFLFIASKYLNPLCTASENRKNRKGIEQKYIKPQYVYLQGFASSKLYGKIIWMDLKVNIWFWTIKIVQCEHSK